VRQGGVTQPRHGFEQLSSGLAPDRFLDQSCNPLSGEQSGVAGLASHLIGQGDSKVNGLHGFALRLRRAGTDVASQT